MDIITWLIVIAVVLALCIAAFAIVRTRQRSGDVVASSPVRNDRGGSS